VQGQNNVTVRLAGPGDEPEVARFQAAFDGPLLPDETARLLSDDRHLLLLGYIDSRPAGFVSGVEVFHPDKHPELFLNEIAVMEETRRRGLARALIEELKRLAERRGCVTIWVLTDEENEAAMSLYLSTGGRWDGQHQVMFEYSLRDS
jgi:ribosomal protein S18 acetylase RimI-like enzyme